MAKPEPKPIQLPRKLAGAKADWLVTTSAAAVIKSRRRPKHVLAVVMISKPPDGRRVSVMAIETTRDRAERSMQAIFDEHSHDVITAGAPLKRALALIDAYVARWLTAKPKDPCACEPIKTAPRAAKPIDNSGCPRENAARRRRARQRTSRHAALHVN